MKIYVLLKQDYEGSETVCISEDINKVKKSIYEDFDQKEDYPELEIWNNGEMMCKATGGDVLRKISLEIE